jgi:hypothetical protein
MSSSIFAAMWTRDGRSNCERLPAGYEHYFRTRQPKPEANVTEWVVNTDESLLYLSVLTSGEIRRGIGALPQSRVEQPWRRGSTRSFAHASRAESSSLTKKLPIGYVKRFLVENLILKCLPLTAMEGLLVRNCMMELLKGGIRSFLIKAGHGH